MSNLTSITPYNPSTNVIFSPRQISGCALWLDAADSASVTLTGSNVTNLRDKSGQNLILSNATGFSYSNVFNGSLPSFFNPNGGRNAINPTATLGRNASFGVTVPFTIFFAGLETGISTSNYGYICDSAPGGVNRPYILGSNLESRLGVGSGVSPVKVPFQACAQYYTSGGAMIVNGTTYYNQVTGLSAFTTGGITIGNRFTLDESWPGHLCEIIIYNKPVPTSERQQIEGYLAWKWNLQANLPTTHPYYNNAYLPNSYPISYFPPRLTPTSVIPVVPGFTIPTTIRQYVFNPTSISGTALWLDGADPLNTGIQPTSGTVISTWSDKSGNGRNATVASGRVAGTFNTAFNCVYFQTSNVGYVTSYAANPTNETMFIVANIDSPANQNNNTIIGGQLGARSFGFGYAGTGGIGRSSYLNNEVAWQTTSIVGPSAGTTALITGTVSGTTNVTVALNGGSSVAGTITAWTAGTTTYLGVDTTTTIYYYKGFVMEILFYNSLLLISQRQQIEGYLAWKWGLQSNLPANHPFKLFPP
jgi:hypothetical protein